MKNYLTFRQLDFALLKQIKLTEGDIPRLTRQTYINNKLMKIYSLMNMVNDPFYKRIATLTVAADQERLADNNINGGVIVSINSVTSTIVRNAGSFVAGSLIDVIIGDPTTGLISYQFKGRITTGGASAIFEVISGTAGSATAPGSFIAVNVTKSLSSTSVDLSAMYIHKIMRVWDGAVGSERGFFLYTDGRAFTEVARDPDMDSEVCAYHRGDTLELKPGDTATAIGVTQAEYRGKPALYTDATENNEIDLPPEQNQILMDEVMAEFLKHAGQELPDELQRRLKEYEEMYAAKAKEEQKDESEKGKRSV